MDNQQLEANDPQDEFAESAPRSTRLRSTRSRRAHLKRDERGGIEKVVAIAIVIGITVAALAAIGSKIDNWVNDVPEPGDVNAGGGGGGAPGDKG